MAEPGHHGTLDLERHLGAVGTLQLSAGPIRMFERGSGPTLVLFHEFPTGAATWRKVVPALAGVRCVTPEWPYGSHSLPLEPDARLDLPSLLDLAAELVRTVSGAPVTLVGSGGGGTLCQLLALRHRELVERLVIATGDAAWSFPAAALRPFQLLARVPVLADAFVHAARLDSFRTSWYSLIAHEVPDPVIRRHYVETLVRSAGARRDVRKALLGLDTCWARQTAKGLAELDVPALVIWGADDRFFPLRHGRRLAATLPDARLVELQHCRTLVGEDQPEHFAELVMEFLSSTTTGLTADVGPSAS